MSLVPKSEDKKFILATLYSVTPPIIVTPGSESDVSDNMKEKYRLESLLNIKEIFEKEEAPDYHVLLWLSFASLQAPPSPIFGKIQLKLTKKFFTEQTECLDEEKLEPYEEEEFLKLKRWIFKEQIKHLKEKIKEKKI